jgi:type IV secretory pathway protease TraF
VTVIGDRADESTDSREFGPLPGSAIVGRPVLRYAPLTRIGLVR